MPGKLVLYYNDLKFQPSESFLHKDFGQVPYVLADIHHLDLEYWIGAARPNPTFDIFRGRKVRQFGKSGFIRHDRLDVLRNRALYRFVEQATDVTHFLIFPFTPVTDLAVARRARKRGARVILKLDTNKDYLTSLAESWHRHRARWRRRLTQAWHYRELLRLADLVICETSDAADILSSRFLDLDLTGKLAKVFSGISETWFEELRVRGVADQERRRSIIVSGRLSSVQKHTETIFAAGPPPPGWTVDFIGAVDDELKRVINRYRETDPYFDDRYRFHGTINDKAAYYALLMQAKALLLNSRGGEGFPNVFAEAHKCRLFIVASDVSGASDATNNGRWGIVYPADDAAALRTALDMLPSRIDALRDEDVPEDHRRRFVWEYSLDQPIFHHLFENNVR